MKARASAKASRRAKNARTKSRRAARSANARQPLSSELLLVNRIVGAQQRGRALAAVPTLHDIIYNFTAETKRYAYKSGFAVGELAAVHFHGINVLERILYAAGMGNVLYYTFESEAKITSAKSASVFSLGAPAHYFEAGIIAGFLSEETGRNIEARETHCKLAGSEFCQFEASPSANPFADVLQEGGLDTEAKLLAEAIAKHANAGASEFSEEYFVLSMMPLLREPLLGSVTKLAYVLGKRLAYELPDAVASLPSILKYLRISGTLDVRKGGGRVAGMTVTVLYSHAMSLSGFVQISSALLQGYLSTVYRTACSVNKSTVAGAYRVVFKA
ncbi:MAG: V4R domain-containing protein [Candidatus Micrarchaeia archaeon]